MIIILHDQQILMNIFKTILFVTSIDGEKKKH